jgi:geranylgeranyl pyrophosphate synthase
VTKAREKAQNLIDEAKDLLSPFGQSAQNLKLLSDYFLERNH